MLSSFHDAEKPAASLSLGSHSLAAHKRSAFWRAATASSKPGSAGDLRRVPECSSKPGATGGGALLMLPAKPATAPVLLLVAAWARKSRGD
jgi:hypothetical protein